MVTLTGSSEARGYHPIDLVKSLSQTELIKVSY